MSTPGPSLQAKRNFAGFKEGTHVPGYLGYCPMIKYKIGGTYGNETHELCKERIPHLHPRDVHGYEQGRQSVIPQCKTSEELPKGFSRKYTISAPPELGLQNEIPDATGDNKYTKDMVPGFTGYIPRHPFLFGMTYKNKCDQGIDEMLTSRKKRDADINELRHTVASIPKLRQVNSDQYVKERLEFYRDRHPTGGVLLDDKRGLTEAPMPGYRGYVPKIKPTEIGLGGRYHVTSEKGFTAFYGEQAKHYENQTKTIDLSREPGAHPSSFVPNIDRRLYKQDGMIPKYTGYLPARRFHFGNTYGDTSRQLPVCAHSFSNYGDYTRALEARS